MSLGSRSSPCSRCCSWRAARQWTSLCRKLSRCHFLKCQLTALRLSPGERGTLTSRVGFEGSKLTQNTSWSSALFESRAVLSLESLPFSQMSVLLVLLYASPPLNLRLSPGDRAKQRKMQYLWPFRHKIFAPVCAQMRWMRPSSPPTAMTSPAGPYCTLRIASSKRAVSHPLAPW